MNQRFAAASLIAICSLAPALGQTIVQLHSGGLWSNYTTVPSVVWTNPVSNKEAADDFNVVGTVTRVVANGSGCWQCQAPVLSGVHVRFYAWQGGVPGALQYQAFVPAGSPGLLYDLLNPEVIDITLPTPFSATGQHFVSVQASFVGGGNWAIWVADFNNATGSPVKFRDNLLTSTWSTYTPPFLTPINADLDLELWGYTGNPTPPPTDPCGQWSVLSPPNVPASTHTLVRDLKVLSSDDVWAVGDALPGVIGAYDNVNVAWHWNGSQWTQVNVPNPTPAPGLTNCALYAVDAAGPNEVYAAGYQSISVPGGWYGPQLQVAKWDGSQWTVLPNTPLPPTSIGAGVSGATVHDVDVVSSNDVWFAGFWINLLPTGATTQPGLLMHYDGSNFTMTNVPLVVSGGQGQSFSKIEAISSNDVWAIGHRYGLSTPLVETGAPLAFHWDGSNWTSLNPPNPGTQSIFVDIAALGPNQVLILGYHTPAPGGPSNAFMLRWDGSSWTTLPGPPSGSSLKAFALNDVYAGGQGVWHWDGTSWTAVQAFPSLSYATFAKIDAIAPCQLWGAGGQTVIGQLMPFAARQESPVFASTHSRNGCAAGSTPGSLAALSLPKLGTFFAVGASDPLSALPVLGGLSYWVISAQPSALSPCGNPVPGAGAGGGVGEILIDLGTLVGISGPVPWTGGAATSAHGVFIPNLPQFASIDAYSQAALFDGANPSSLILTNGLDIHVGY